METDKKIQILLSTFNGERYIREQLDSYLHLSNFSEVSVLIRDDGSTDNTVNILREYERSYGFHVISGKNVGVNRSFFELLEKRDTSCDFFALSDQDDVWLPNKLAAAVDALRQADEGVPALFGSCSTVVTEKLMPISSTLIPHREPDFFNAMVQNVIPGHTQVMNGALADCLEYDHAILVIDWWIYLVAAGLGQVFFLSEPTVLHRQHRSNTIGYSTNKIKRVCMRFKRLREGKANQISRQLSAFYAHYHRQLKEEYALELQNYILAQSKLSRRSQYALRCRAYRQTTGENLIFKMMYVCGQYNLKDGMTDGT